MRAPDAIRAEERRRGQHFVQGLCGECGNLFERWYSTRYHPPRPRDRSQFVECVFLARCVPCGARTVHAKIRNDANRNRSEELQNLVCGIGPVTEYQRRTWRYFDRTDDDVRRNAEYTWWHCMEIDLVGHIINAGELATLDRASTEHRTTT